MAGKDEKKSEYISIGYLVLKEGDSSIDENGQEIKPGFVDIDAHLRFVEDLFPVKEDKMNLLEKH